VFFNGVFFMFVNVIKIIQLVFYSFHDELAVPSSTHASLRFPPSLPPLVALLLSRNFKSDSATGLSDSVSRCGLDVRAFFPGPGPDLPPVPSSSSDALAIPTSVRCPAAAAAAAGTDAVPSVRRWPAAAAACVTTGCPDTKRT
jgi:hypothetical protein